MFDTYSNQKLKLQDFLNDFAICVLIQYIYFALRLGLQKALHLARSSDFVKQKAKCFWKFKKSVKLDGKTKTLDVIIKEIRFLFLDAVGLCLNTL